MALYAIGDLHLHFASDLKAPGQLNSRLWQNHEQRFADACAALIKPDDTLLLLGDHSWGKNLDQAAPDLDYICRLPGKKILLRGNHDMFWDAKKTAQLNSMYEGRLRFLQNNFYPYRDFALVGTKGYTFEGPFRVNARGQVIGWDESAKKHADALVEREMERLEASFQAACRQGYSRFIMFLHYPPTSVLERESDFTRIAEKYRVQQVVYAHCHGQARFHDSVIGMMHGIRYDLASGDYLKWQPLKILP